MQLARESSFASWKEMDRQVSKIFSLLKSADGVVTKEKDYINGNLENKYRIWIELKVAESLLLKKYEVILLRGKKPDLLIKSRPNILIEVKSFDKINFKEQELKLALVEYLDRNISEWKSINFQLFIGYWVASQSVVNEKRRLSVLLLDEKESQRLLFEKIANALKNREVEDPNKDAGFHNHSFEIIYFDDHIIETDRKIFINNSYSGDDEKWLLSRVSNLAEDAKNKFVKGSDLNILFIHYPFIERDYIEEHEWEVIKASIWKDYDIANTYNAILLSDFRRLFIASHNIRDDVITNIFGAV